MLNHITGDVVWKVIQGERKRGLKAATVNRSLSWLRAVLRMARDDWQWIDAMPKIRMLPGEVERDRWLTRTEADRLIACCAPHLAAMVRYALATGCRAREVADLEWNRVDLVRRTAWLNQTKNGTPKRTETTQAQCPQDRDNSLLTKGPDQRSGRSLFEGHPSMCRSSGLRAPIPGFFMTWV
jgi:integrase